MSWKRTLKPVRISLKMVVFVLLVIHFSSEIANAMNDAGCKTVKKQIGDYLEDLNFLDINEAKKQEMKQKLNHWKSNILLCNLPLNEKYGKSRTTLLHLATAVNEVETVRQFVSKEMDLYSTLHTSNGNLNPLHLAALFNSIDVVAFLLDNQINNPLIPTIDVNSKTSRGQTALHLATINGSIPMMELLLEKGANINAKDIYGTTALHLSISNLQFEKVKFLTERGADVRVKRVGALTPLHQLAVKENTIPFMKLLLEKGADINALAYHEKTPLHYSIANSIYDNAKFLINYGANVNARYIPKESNSDTVPDYQGRTPLQEAAGREGSISVMELLLQKGADINVKDYISENTPLHISILNGIYDNAKYLIENGADINAQTRNGLTPLHQAVNGNQYANQKQIIKLLLDNNANINILDKNGQSALHAAVVKNCLECAKILVERGINTRLTDQQGRTAYLFAVSGGTQNTEMVEFLQSLPH